MAEEDTKTEETDWKAKYEAMRDHAREWERKAKANQGEGDELARARAEAKEAKDELERLKGEASIREARAKVSKETGVPAEFVVGDDEESMTKYAKAEVRAAYERGDFFTPTLDLVSTNGTQFRNGEVDTELVATVRWAGLAITTTSDLKAKLGEPYHLRWGVSQEGGAVGYLEDFDDRIGADGFSLSVTKRDVGERATFFCDLMSE